MSKLALVWSAGRDAKPAPQDDGKARGAPIIDLPAREIDRFELKYWVPTIHCEEVLEYISKRREWFGKYPIARAMVVNPKTPVAVSMRILPRLSVRDLREVGRDRNIPDAVRSSALRLYTIKQK